MSSFICSAISKSAAGFLGERAAVGCDLDIDFRIASDLALDGDRFALMFEGERGMSGDTAFEEGAILIGFSTMEFCLPWQSEQYCSVLKGRLSWSE